MISLVHNDDGVLDGGRAGTIRTRWIKGSHIYMKSTYALGPRYILLYAVK